MFGRKKPPTTPIEPKLPQPDPAAELCPTFLVNGDTIVDVLYTSWLEVGDGRWNMSGDMKFTATSEIDRIVYELPIGCWQSDLFAYEGTEITFKGGGGSDEARECNDKPQFAICEQENVYEVAQIRS